MARLAVGMVFGIVVGVLGGAALGIHADDEVEAAALEAHVDPVDLAGAVATTGVGPREYLAGVGELVRASPPPPVPDPLDRVVLCLEQHESRGVASAVNPRSGASGPLQFLPSTWRTTPQGKAGLSVFDPQAARAAAKWMLSVGRGREFSTRGLC